MRAQYRFLYRILQYILEAHNRLQYIQCRRLQYLNTLRLLQYTNGPQYSTSYKENRLKYTLDGIRLTNYSILKTSESNNSNIQYILRHYIYYSIPQSLLQYLLAQKHHTSSYLCTLYLLQYSAAPQSPTVLL